MKRIYSIDFMRGFVMIIMVLDHVRDFMHTTSIAQSPTDLNTTTPALFFTRWVTHLCAPTFVFLSGTSAFISMFYKNDIKSTRKFLLTRGLWLIVLEFTLVNFGLWFDVHFDVFLFDVIATIGFGFIVLGLLLKLKPQTIGIIGLAIIFLHNLAPFVPGAETSLFKKILMPFFAPGAFPFGNGKVFIMGYPPIPWLGIMLVGFAAGEFFKQEEHTRKKFFAKIGLTSIALFIIIRAINIYGDSFNWMQQKNSFYTLLSFINVTKYPPSLDFILLFLGIMFLILSAAEGIRNKFTDIASVYG
ncbi:MAG: heparan-alpha-glucosaminide N-acetyltransferase domain-containing protein, partial [Parafilimonas sp.]